GSYLGVFAQIEHFLEYREMVKANIEEQLAACLEEEARVRSRWEAAQAEAQSKAVATASSLEQVAS
ncbi:MAG: B12-binding domain-containing radical SAM protein, partial [Prochlorothrix sp.]